MKYILFTVDGYIIPLAEAIGKEALVGQVHDVSLLSGDHTESESEKEQRLEVDSEAMVLDAVDLLRDMKDLESSEYCVIGDSVDLLPFLEKALKMGFKTLYLCDLTQESTDAATTLLEAKSKAQEKAIREQMQQEYDGKLGEEKQQMSDEISKIKQAIRNALV